VFHRKENTQHRAFAATAPFKQTQSSQFARRTWSIAAVKKNNVVVQAAREVSSDEDDEDDGGFDLLFGTSLLEYVAMGMVGMFLGFFSSGVSYF
jgi:hypothetical protein